MADDKLTEYTDMEYKSMDENKFLVVKDLRVEYTSDSDVIKAVNGVSFALERGKTLGLVGETGAGKTSIAKAILRILPDPPAKVRSGQVLFEGRDLMKISEAEMRKIRGRRISMIFQDPMTALNPVMKVGEQIAEVIRLHSDLKKKEAEQQAVRTLEMVGINADRFSEYPHQFSGGMKQRVVIAMALACSPELLLADEPTTALDVTIQAQVLEMVNRLKGENNTAMILITHDLGVVAEVCDEVAVVYAGEIIEYGKKEDIFLDPRHPYTKGLFAALPTLDTDSDRLNPIPGTLPDPTRLPEGCKFYDRCSCAQASCAKEGVELAKIGPGHSCRCIRVMRGEI